jgi:single-stranded DNA-specific DHH superfamily exonuclease
MEFMFQKEFEKLSRIIQEKVKNSKTIGICFDSDADGCSSAALLLIYLLEEFKKYPDNLISCFHDVDERLKNLKNDLIFILDTQPKKTDSSNFIIVDHHIVTFIPKKSSFFNPMLFNKKSYIATSCLLYNILNNLTDMSKACWIAALGAKADKSEESCKDVIELTDEMYPEFKDVEKRLIRLASVSRNLPDASLVVKSLVECYNIGSPSFFGKTECSSRLLRISREIDREVMNVLSKAEKILETEKVVVYRIDSEFNVQSIIANKIFLRHSKKVIVVYNTMKNKEIIHSEVRSNQEWAFDEFSSRLSDIVEDLGGHKQAFGLSISRMKIPEFLNRLSKF